MKYFQENVLTSLQNVMTRTPEIKTEYLNILELGSASFYIPDFYSATYRSLDFICELEWLCRCETIL